LNDRSAAFATYWRVLWSGIVTTIAGLGVTVKYLFSRPITVEYPDVLPEIPDGWRGLHAFERDRCNLCHLCERSCPVQCITIEAEGKGKKARLLRYEIDYGQCLFCNLCCEACPMACLWMGAEWDLVSYTREGCVVRLDAKDPDEERKKLWPSMKTHPARLRDKAKREEGQPAPGAENKKSETGPAENREPRQ